MTSPTGTQGAVLAVASEHYAQRRSLVGSVTLALAQWWAYISRSDVTGSWERDVAPGLLAVATEGQRRAATEAGTYLARLAELQAPAAPLARVTPAGFVGQAADLRPLPSLLDVSRQHSLRLVAQGMPVTEALDSGLTHVQRSVASEVADAGRNADHAAMVATPTMQGYVRFLDLPSCDRCVVLAGRFYRWSSGFQRHPTCDCSHLPSAVANPDPTLLTDPAAALASGLVRGLSQADQQALADGADLGRVVNAKRTGMTVSGAGVQRRGRRLTPASIYARAGENREMALELLARNGYVA